MNKLSMLITVMLVGCGHKPFEAPASESHWVHILISDGSESDGCRVEYDPAFFGRELTIAEVKRICQAMTKAANFAATKRQR